MESIFNIIPGPQEDTCCILLYGSIGDGGWADVNASGIVTQLMEAERTYRKIDVRINSIGGEVFTGIAIFNALRQSKADITIYIDCIAASTASFIAGCGRPVKMGRYAQLMLHRPSSYACGNAEDLKNSAAQLEQIEAVLCQIYSERTGKSVDEIRTTYMDGADHWLTAEEALSLGFVDEIYDDPHAIVTDALSPEERCNRYTALYLDMTDVSHKNHTQMINKFKSMPTFRDCADETAVMARVDELVHKAGQHDAVVAERDAFKAKVADYEQREREAADAAIAAEVDAAVLDGRIGEDQREHYTNLLRTDKAEDARSILAALKPKRRASAVVDKSGGQPVDVWAERFAEIRGGLKK